jgi:hypothetical protein
MPLSSARSFSTAIRDLRSRSCTSAHRGCLRQDSPPVRNLAAVRSPVRLVVGVDDLLLDPAASCHLHALCLCPRPNISDVAATATATASATLTPRTAASRAWYNCLPLKRTALLDEGRECIPELLRVLLGEVSLIFLTINAVPDRLWVSDPSRSSVIYVPGHASRTSLVASCKLREFTPGRS